jgi:ABC-type Mn2+/Zn2+ transport system permease subunit
MIGVACAYGVMSVAVGLLGSYYLDTAASATVAVVAVAAFFVTLMIRSTVRS